MKNKNCLGTREKLEEIVKELEGYANASKEVFGENHVKYLINLVEEVNQLIAKDQISLREYVKIRRRVVQNVIENAPSEPRLRRNAMDVYEKVLAFEEAFKIL